MTPSPRAALWTRSGFGLRRPQGELVALSDRFRPVATDAGSELVRAAQRARPEAKLYGSATLSDLTFFAAADAVKAGPGESARSHRPDEFVTVGELASGATFYEQLLVELASAVGSDAALLDSPGARA